MIIVEISQIRINCIAQHESICIESIAHVRMVQWSGLVKSNQFCEGTNAFLYVGEWKLGIVIVFEIVYADRIE